MKYRKRKVGKKEEKHNLHVPTFEEFVNTFLREQGLSIEFLKLGLRDTLDYLVSIGKNFKDVYEACKYKLNIVCNMLSTYLSKHKLIKDIVFEPIVTNELIQIIAKFKAPDVGIEIPMLIHECIDCQVIYDNLTELEKFIEEIVKERIKYTKELGTFNLGDLNE